MIYNQSSVKIVSGQLSTSLKHLANNTSCAIYSLDLLNTHPEITNPEDVTHDQQNELRLLYYTQPKLC